ncbi:hypothetical protein D3C84_1186640 [compost metagenome]
MLPEVVGLAVNPQTIPRSLTVAPPSEVTFPPKVDFKAPTFDAAVVVTVGTVATAAPCHLIASSAT